MSQVSASSHPPPSAKPETAAIIGVRQPAIRPQSTEVGLAIVSWNVRSRIALMSAPAAK